MSIPKSVKSTFTVAALLLLLTTAVATAQESERALVLTVFPFRTMAAPAFSFLGDSFSEALTTRLVGLRQVKVYERSQFDKLAGELRLEKDASGFFDQANLARVGSVVSIDYALLGSVTMGEGSFSCSARLVHVNSGRVQLAREFRGAYPAELFKVQDLLSAAVAEALSLHLNEFDMKRLSRRPTGSEEAFDYFNRSLAAADRTERARLLELAIARDPSFIAARQLLADVWLELERPDRAVAEYRAVLLQDPGEYRAAYNLGLLLLDEGRIDEARSSFEACTRLKPGDPDAFYHLGLSWEFSASGERYGADADLATAAKLYEYAAALDPLHHESRLAGGIIHAALAQAEADPAIRLGYLRAAERLFTGWLLLAAEDAQAGEIAANLELIRMAVHEHEEWLAADTEDRGSERQDSNK
jgi:tetratricopeptide (TPR) repeat protein